MNKGKADVRTMCGAVVLALCALLVAPVLAEQKLSDGAYDVHYNAIDSQSITADIARQYKISRGQNVGLLVLSVLRTQPLPTRPVSAMLKGRLRNEIGQDQTLAFKEVVEGTAIYYLASFRHDHNERLQFQITLQPEGQARQIELKFGQMFFTH